MAGDFFDNIGDSIIIESDCKDDFKFITDRRLFVSTHICTEDDLKFNEPEFVTSVIEKRLNSFCFKSKLKFDIHTTKNEENAIYTDVRINGQISNSIDAFELLWLLNYGLCTKTKKNCIITFLDPLYFDKDAETLISEGKIENVADTPNRLYMFDNGIINKYMCDKNWKFNVYLNRYEIAMISDIIHDMLLNNEDNRISPYSEILRLYSYCGNLDSLIDNIDVVPMHIQRIMEFYNRRYPARNHKPNMIYPVPLKSLPQENREQIEDIILKSKKRLVGIYDVLKNIYMDNDNNWCKRTLYLSYKDNIFGRTECELVAWNGFPSDMHHTPIYPQIESYYFDRPDDDEMYDDITHKFINNINQVKKTHNIRKLYDIKDGWNIEFDCVADNNGDVLFVIHIGELYDYDSCTVISASLGLYGSFSAVLENIRHLFNK